MNSIHNNLIAALSLCATFAAPNMASAIAISGKGTWETTLQGRDLDGNLATSEAYYDTALNITWLADANYTMTTGYDADGMMNWYAANVWAATLNPYYRGIMGWRLPRIRPIDGVLSDYNDISHNGSEDQGYNISAPGTLYAGSTASELAHLFYNTLGNKSACAIYSVFPACSYQPDRGLMNSGPFSNIQDRRHYYSGDSFMDDPGAPWAWGFEFRYGYQDFYSKSSGHVWAVHDGDVGVAIPASTVPIPAAAWLFGSGLLGLFGMAKRKRVA